MRLHWALACLVLLAVASIQLRAALPSGHAWRPALRDSHLFIGQLVLWLSVLRVWVRQRHPVAPAAGVPAWSKVAARVSHGLLYVVLLAQPVLGVLMQQAGDKHVVFLGLELPALMAPDVPAYFALKKAHELLAYGFLALVLLHVCAALWHHVVRKDSTLRDMGPGQRAEARSAAATADVPLAVQRRMVAIVHAGGSATQLAAQSGIAAHRIAGWVAEDAARRGAVHGHVDRGSEPATTVPTPARARAIPTEL